MKTCGQHQRSIIFVVLGSRDSEDGKVCIFTLTTNLAFRTLKLLICSYEGHPVCKIASKYPKLSFLLRPSEDYWLSQVNLKMAVKTFAYVCVSNTRKHSAS